MPRTPKVPTYRRHKGRDLAFVLIGKKTTYLGRWNSPESKAEYARVIREWAATGGQGPVVRSKRGTASLGPRSDLTISEMLVAFLRHADRHYRDRDGNPTDESENYKAAIKPLRALYGATIAAEFGPLALQAVRGEMVASGLARTTTNGRIGRIRRVFRWAASMELIPSAIADALGHVAGLQAGRTEARETEPIGPVPLDVVAATLPHLSPVVAAMVQVQLHSGCRAGEVMKMRNGEVIPGPETWTYRPGRHKGVWRGKGRAIPLGPKAVEALKPFLKPDAPDDHVFSPGEATELVRASRAEARKTKRTPSELAKASASPARVIAERYDRRAYRQAIVRACDRAFPHPTLATVSRAKLLTDQKAELKAWRKEHRWSPLQLRHTAATAIRERFGLEAAQVALGHAKADVTQLYAERDLAKAREVAAEMG